MSGMNHFYRSTLKIADLTVDATAPERFSVIEDTTFRECHIFGPAVLIPLEGGVFNECIWDSGTLDAAFWGIRRTRRYVVGAVGVRRCEFYACRFTDIGIAGRRGLRRKFERLFT